MIWQVGGVTGATLGTYYTFNGNILSAKAIILETGAVLNGRALAQTQVTLNANPVSAPNQNPGVLAVTSITPVQTSATADNAFADGWSYLFDITMPTNESNLEMEFADWSRMGASSTIPVANDIQISSAQAASTTPISITAANAYSTPALDMIGNLSTSTLERHVQVLVQMKIPLYTINGSYTTSYGVQTLPY